MIALIIRPVRYSIRPWPKGWSLSGFLEASKKPSKVMTEEPASDKLLKASAIIATEPEIKPAKYLAANKRMLSIIP